VIACESLCGVVPIIFGVCTREHMGHLLMLTFHVLLSLSLSCMLPQLDLVGPHSRFELLDSRDTIMQDLAPLLQANTPVLG
jgi:hypothetical protein